MAQKLTPSQFRSKMCQLEQKQKRAINEISREVNDYKRKSNKAINDCNAAVRKYNANVRRNKQIISNALRNLNKTTAVRTRYDVSLRAMLQHYEDVGRIYYEGVSVTPDQDRILDLIEQEQANSLITENHIEGGQATNDSPEDIEIGNKLALISEDLNNRWKGAVFALNPNNPDATRHFCTSTRELFTEFIEMKAPDKKVFDYNPHCERTKDGNATRREKIKYMMRNIHMDESVVSFVDADIKNILDLNHVLSGGTHGPAGKYTSETLHQVKKRVEQGINFLCEISRSA